MTTLKQALREFKAVAGASDADGSRALGLCVKAKNILGSLSKDLEFIETHIRGLPKSNESRNNRMALEAIDRVTHRTYEFGDVFETLAPLASSVIRR